MSHREEALRQTQDMLEAWEHLGILPEELEEAPGEREVWHLCLGCCPATQSQMKRKKKRQ